MALNVTTMTDPNAAPACAQRSQRWVTVLDDTQLRQLRRQHGVSRHQVAAKAGISQSTIAWVEPCSRTTCRSRTLGRLAAALHVQPATLTPDGPPVSRPRVTSGQTAGATIWPDALPNSIREPSGPGADPDSVTVSPSAR